jgi:NADH-quinone oxidoreductase subunit L
LNELEATINKLVPIIVLAPLVAAIVCGLFCRVLDRRAVHWIANLGVAAAFFLSLPVAYYVLIEQQGPYNFPLYTWLVSDGLNFQIGFLIDELTATMVVVVSFVSWMVHIYTIGYMADDPGYNRFFSYIALFTFAMLMLVTANNFLQLFFSWEAVGLVSYLLIGFWFKRPTAIYANLKAFIVNRVGDFGFLLGIAAIYAYFHTLDYTAVFSAAPEFTAVTLNALPGQEWSVLSMICLLLFIGAMGKSAQVPLHVWLPDSMEGPTPISALIHAATMVTAGIFMVARMSPLYELSETALSVILVIGAVTAFFMGLLGLVQNDIKRVIAYSTLSQLGYMTVALGASAYSAAIFHLVTHAFFKALLFLAAGSVIIALHHEQDMRHMGGLRRHMPVTWITSLVGSLALIGFPGFAGFYSKDAIIEAVHLSDLPGANIAYYAVLCGVFVTALYTFRMFFLVFHGKERIEEHARAHLRESPLVVTVPLVLLAIPSVFIGAVLVEGMLFGKYFGQSIVVGHEHDVLTELGHDFHGWAVMALHGLKAEPFWLAIAGVAVAWLMYIRAPGLPEKLANRVRWVYQALINKYGFDEFNDRVVAAGGRLAGNWLWRYGDAAIIDGVVVNGSARAVQVIAGVARRIQSGYLYHYAFAIIIGLLVLIGVFVHGIRV